MRLTTVAAMTLGAGTVHRYGVDVTPAGDPDLPLSFDQLRHVGLGRRPGSWMALAFRPRAEVAALLALPGGDDVLAGAWHRVIDRHGTLRTVVVDEAAPRLRTVDVRFGGWSACPAEPGEDPRAVLRREFDVACDPFAAPSHRLCVVRPDDPGERPTIVVGLDHSHTDAWSLLVLLRDLTAALDELLGFVAEDGAAEGAVDGVADGVSPATVPAPPARVPAFADHTLELAARPCAPAEVHERWAGIMLEGAGEMPVFPLDLGDVSEPREEVVEVRDVLGPEGVAHLEEAARAAGVRMISLAMADMARVIRERAGVPLRAVLPVHSRTGPVDDPRRWHDSMGWFITNSVVECPSAEPRDCADEIARAVRLGSHALGPILEPWGGMPHTPGMFAISWLDNRRLPVRIGPDAASGPQHVSAVIRTTGVMVWFVVGDDGLHLRCRYPDTPEARVSVGGWLDEVCGGLRGRALRAARGADDPVVATAY